MRTTIFCLVLLCLAACTRTGELPGSGRGIVEARPPNIVFIMADDLGYGDLGSYGQTRILTPNLDRMAAEGIRFTQFYSGSTVCAPSRSVLMTGQHTGNTPIRGNKELRPIGQEPLPAESVTIAEVLKQAGYATGAFGKWGLGGPGSEGVPTRQGFNTFFGYLDQRRAHFYYPEFLFRGEERVPLEGNVVKPDDFSGPGAGQPLEKAHYSHDVIANEALAFIETHRDEPFFMYVPFTIPHAELLVPEEALESYLSEDGTSIFPEEPYPGGHYSPQTMPNATYAAMITRMDKDVGRILEKLEELGLDENTIVFFTSDNGPQREGGFDPEFFASSGSLRGGKRDLYEGGIRVPMIVWGPGQVEPGQVSDHIWAMWDVLPTLSAFAGVEAPSGIDGFPMANAISGAGAVPEHDHLYWEFYEGESAQAVRMGAWKAVRRPMFTGDIELYDLEADPGEEHDIAAAHPDIVSAVIRIMEDEHEPSPLWAAPSRL